MFNGFIDFIFSPFFTFFTNLINMLYKAKLSIPSTFSLKFFDFFNYFSLLGPNFRNLIVTIFLLSFVYSVIFLVTTAISFIHNFKNSIKWWWFNAFERCNFYSFSIFFLFWFCFLSWGFVTYCFFKIF